MGYPQPALAKTSSRPVNLITFCSCYSTRTEIEQKEIKQENIIMWIKDAAAGAGLIIFMVSSFFLAGAAHTFLAGI
jgi:hypothetical protein